MTNRSNFVMGSLAYPGNPYNGHTLITRLSQVERITGKKPENVFEERDYRGHSVSDSQDFISGQKCGVNAKLSYAGHNMRILPKKVRNFCVDFW